MIQISDLDFWYSKRTPLFDKLNVDMSIGKIHGVLGLNGTGKSTLLKLIAGNIFAKSGTVNIDNYDISERETNSLQDIYFLQEEFNIPSITMESYVDTHAVFYPDFDREKFFTILAKFIVPKKVKFNRLSLGQKKKAMIAFGLSTNCKILVFDEPTNGLDIPSKSQFRKVVAKELQEDQMLVISTHQVRDLGQMLDSIVILDQGKIIFNQDIQQIEQTLLFKDEYSVSQTADSLYTEKSMANIFHILPNPNAEQTEIQLEVLFNAITENASLITEQFNG